MPVNGIVSIHIAKIFPKPPIFVYISEGDNVSRLQFISGVT